MILSSKLQVIMPPRILIIEDEPEIAGFLLRGLREEGYAAEHAADGEAGWQALQAGTWDVVLLDWWLPKIDGLTLLPGIGRRGIRQPCFFSRRGMQCPTG